MRAALVARLVILGILPSASVGVVLRASLIATLVISGISFSIFVAFVLRAAVGTKSVTVGVLFLTSVFFFFGAISIFGQPWVLDIFLSTFSIFSALVANPLQLSTLESIVLF